MFYQHPYGIQLKIVKNSSITTHKTTIKPVFIRIFLFLREILVLNVLQTSLAFIALILFLHITGAFHDCRTDNRLTSLSSPACVNVQH